MFDNMKRIEELIAELNLYRDAYYNHSTSIVSDYIYDSKFDELKQLEQEIGIVFANSPTQNVGCEIKSNLEKVVHSHPMLSLDKTKSVDGLIKFINGREYVLSLKMDGLTCLLTYDNGELVQAETRGDGRQGEDITHNAKVFDNIPLTIPYKHRIEFEGEAIITYDNFEKINKRLPDDKKYKNPRNLASGSVRQLDSKIAKDRHIKFVVWKVPNRFEKVTDNFDFAKSMGFDVVPYVATNDTEHIEFLINDRKEVAKAYSYPIDGLVCTYNDIKYGELLGMTEHHPKHSIAFKFYDEEVETTLIDVEWTCGKSGRLTPVAVFEPVEISGSTIQRASLHNISIINNLDLHCGDRIVVCKSNDVIPQIIYNNSKGIHNKNNNMITIPSVCPICGSDTVISQENDTAFLSCNNPNCKGKILSKLVHFCSKNAMNIEGLSESTLSFLIENNMVESFLDIYRLKTYLPFITQWKNTSGFGEKSVNKILDAIENSKKTTLDRFIYALSIPMIGKTASKTISKYFNGDFEIFYKSLTNNFDWTHLENLGWSMSFSLNQYAMYSDMDELLQLGKWMNFQKPATTAIGADLAGMTFVITGSLGTFTNRDEAKEKIESLGGKVAGSVSKNTTYLVNNDINSTSGKNKKAKDLGIPIITEEELLNILHN